MNAETTLMNMDRNLIDSFEGKQYLFVKYLLIIIGKGSIAMPEFMLLIRNETDHQALWSQEKHSQFLKACEVYINNLKNDGKLISAQPLIRQGKMISGSKGNWKEGNYADTKEVIVGYYHIRADNPEEAAAIAKGNPEFEFGTTARVEVRPIKTKEEKTGFVYPEMKK